MAGEKKEKVRGLGDYTGEELSRLKDYFKTSRGNLDMTKLAASFFDSCRNYALSLRITDDEIENPALLKIVEGGDSTPVSISMIGMKSLCDWNPDRGAKFSTFFHSILQKKTKVPVGMITLLNRNEAKVLKQLKRLAGEKYPDMNGDAALDKILSSSAKRSAIFDALRAVYSGHHKEDFFETRYQEFTSVYDNAFEVPVEVQESEAGGANGEDVFLAFSNGEDFAEAQLRSELVLEEVPVESDSDSEVDWRLNQIQEVFDYFNKNKIFTDSYLRCMAQCFAVDYLRGMCGDSSDLNNARELLEDIASRHKFLEWAVPGIESMMEEYGHIPQDKEIAKACGIGKTALSNRRKDFADRCRAWLTIKQE